MTTACLAPLLRDGHDTDAVEDIEPGHVLVRSVVDRAGALSAKRADAEWMVGAAMPPEYDGHEHQADRHAGVLSVAVGVRHEGGELPVRVVLQVCDA